VNDLADNYASLPAEDIERLALDVTSLTPEARATLRSEMERRHFPTQSLDTAAQQREPKPTSWAEDWKNMGKGSKAVLISLAVLVVTASLWGAVLNILSHDYANAAAFPFPVALLGFRFVIFPFRIAWAARRRGGRFNRWLAGSLLFGFIFSGIAYLIWKADKPILPEYMQIATPPL
jgi:hypothetical protein